MYIYSLILKEHKLLKFLLLVKLSLQKNILLQNLKRSPKFFLDPCTSIACSCKVSFVGFKSVFANNCIIPIRNRKKSSSTLKEPQNVHKKGKDASINHKNISKYMNKFFILKYLIIFLNKNPSMFELKLATIKYLHPRLLKLSSKQLRKVGEFHLQDH